MKLSPFTRRLRHLVDTIHGGNVKEAARQIGLPQPTLHALYTGVAQAPRRKTVARLTVFYGVSEDWLKGHSGRATKPDYAKPIRHPEGLPSGHWVEILGLDDRALFHWRRFEGMCYDAWVRDQETRVGAPAWRIVWLGLRALVLGAREQDYVLVKREKGRLRFSWLDFDEAIPARIKHLEVLFEPWFDGSAALDYKALINDVKKLTRARKKGLPKQLRDDEFSLPDLDLRKVP